MPRSIRESLKSQLLSGLVLVISTTEQHAALPYQGSARPVGLAAVRIHDADLMVELSVRERSRTINADGSMARLGGRPNPTADRQHYRFGSGRPTTAQRHRCPSAVTDQEAQALARWSTHPAVRVELSL